MKKRITLLLMMALCTFSFGNLLHAQSSSDTWDGKKVSSWTKGEGTASSPFLIEEPAHLAFLSQEVRGGKTFEGIFFKQTASLDMGLGSHDSLSVVFMPIGIYDAGTSTDENNNSVPFDNTTYFNGVYDGNRQTIKNLFVNYDPDTQKTIGGAALFGAVGQKGIIKNVVLSKECCLISTGSVASIVNMLEGRLMTSSSEATLQGSTHTGGLVAFLSGGTVDRCFYKGKIKGTLSVGGLVGYMDLIESNPSLPTIKNSYAVSENLSDAFYVGGAIGSIFGEPIVENVYAAGTMLPNQFMSGGFIGTIDEALLKKEKELKIKNCFWDSSTIPYSDPCGDGKMTNVKGVTTEQLKGKEILAQLGDSFIADEKNENSGYPVLKDLALSVDEVMPEGLFYTLSSDGVHVKKATSEELFLFDTAGNLLYRGFSSFVPLEKGNFYILRVEDKSIKILF